MNCNQFRQFYSDFADGFLEESEVVGFHVHMAECEPCRRFHEALEQGCSTLQRLEPETPSFDFDSKLFDRIMRECVESEPQVPAPVLRQWSGMAGAALVAVALGLVAWEAGSLARNSRTPAQAGRPGSNATESFVVRFAGDTSLRFPGRFPVVPVSRDSFVSSARPAQSFEITVDWMTP